MLFCLLSNFPRVVLEDDQIYFICGQGGPERKFQLNIRKKEKKKNILIIVCLEMSSLLSTEKAIKGGSQETLEKGWMT